ncbi:hypothetical protein D9M72_577540 [compost metagenome]
MVGLAADACKRRQKNQRYDHGQIFDNQPTNGDAPPLSIDETKILHRAQKYHCTCGRECKTKNQPGFHIPTKRQAKGCAQCCCCRNLRQRAGNRNGFH